MPRKGFGVHLYRRSNKRRSPCGLRPKGPFRPFGTFFLIVYCRLSALGSRAYIKSIALSSNVSLPLLRFVKAAVRMISSENFRFSGGPPDAEK